MRRGVIVWGGLGMFAALLALTTLAEARAGGGTSSGSRGSRSYSVPRTPSVALTSPAPASPAQMGQTPSSPPQPGGMFGRWGGMIGGFLLGGLLFGGLGQGFGGIGLLDVLIVAGLALLALVPRFAITVTYSWPWVTRRAAWTGARAWPRGDTSPDV